MIRNKFRDEISSYLNTIPIHLHLNHVAISSLQLSLQPTPLIMMIIWKGVSIATSNNL